MAIRYCRNCLRHTETDTIKAVRYGTFTIPAYAVCTYCGYCHGAIEETA
ncbi:hypothetical protein [Mycolicibacterium fortuitum]|nr:hypothetical protein [Mycolicibacterium fortuitum]MDG5773933.1 hypothetical protein [Mycolicibacterium fortuitum]MDG5779681.1 hypothetical protein [Mycolicibacterium fortuitum]